MAYTATKVMTTVFGNVRVVGFNVAADAASGSVATGLKNVLWCDITPISMTTGAPHLKINTDATSAAAAGTIFISSAASTDNFFLVAYGT